MLSRYGLHSKYNTLPNATEIRYDTYTIPCCVTCNSLLGKEVENPVSDIIAGGYERVANYLRTEGCLLIFVWLALIFFKTHLKDTRLRLHRDLRQPDTTISDLYDVTALHHVHAIARAPYSRPVLDPEVFGSFLAVPASVSANYDQFDYGDLFETHTTLIRLGDTCFIAVLDDSCASAQVCEKITDAIVPPLSPIQLRELAAHLAHANSALKDRPQFRSIFSETEGFRIVCDRPAKVALGEMSADRYGAILSYITDPILSQFHNSNIDDIRRYVRAGNYTFLFDEQGRFLVNSMERLEDTSKG